MAYCLHWRDQRGNEGRTELLKFLSQASAGLDEFSERTADAPEVDLGDRWRGVDGDVIVVSSEKDMYVLLDVNTRMKRCTTILSGNEIKQSFQFVNSKLGLRYLYNTSVDAAGRLVTNDYNIVKMRNGTSVEVIGIDFVGDYTGDIIYKSNQLLKL